MRGLETVSVERRRRGNEIGHMLKPGHLTMYDQFEHRQTRMRQVAEVEIQVHQSTNLQVSPALPLKASYLVPQWPH